MSATHAYMLNARHWSGESRLIGSPVSLALCTFAQSLYWSFYFLFRDSVTAKLASTLHGTQDVASLLLTLMDISFVLSATIIVYRVYVAVITYSSRDTAGDSWFARYADLYFAPRPKVSW